MNDRDRPPAYTDSGFVRSRHGTRPLVNGGVLGEESRRSDVNARSDVPPETLSVELADGGIRVEYADGRAAFYHGVPEPVDESLRVPGGKELHLLVTDPDGSEGVLVYVNDRRTHDEILEDTGVGRVLVEKGESETVFPGVRVELDGYARVVTADPDVAGGRVFAFVEDEMSEDRYEFVANGYVADHGDDQ
jgi:hypothetical protein